MRYFDSWRCGAAFQDLLQRFTRALLRYGEFVTLCKLNSELAVTRIFYFNGFQETKALLKMLFATLHL